MSIATFDYGRVSITNNLHYPLALWIGLRFCGSKDPPISMIPGSWMVSTPSVVFGGSNPLLSGPEKSGLHLMGDLVESLSSNRKPQRPRVRLFLILTMMSAGLVGDIAAQVL